MPYSLRSVQRLTVASGEDGIPNTVPIDCVTLLPTQEQVSDNLHETMHTTRHQNEIQQRGNPVNDKNESRMVYRMCTR